jgi:hypothetical protein
MGLDDEKIDDPAYRPRAQWRLATGTGVGDVGGVGSEWPGRCSRGAVPAARNSRRRAASS